MRKKIIIGALALLVLAGLAAGAGAWLVFGPNTPAFEGERSVYIPRGADFAEVADSLASSGVVRTRRTLELMASVTGWGEQAKAGHYVFSSGASNYAILQKLRRGLQEPVRVTIPPGTRPEVVAAVAGRDMEFSAEAFEAALRDSALAAELGTDPEHLFGYMLPETYFFYWLQSPEDVVRRIKQEFDRFYERELAAAAQELNLTKDDVIALAGIVEWEAHLLEERPRVAGVYLNRLRIGMKLDADPTVQYIVMQREGQKRRLLYDDLDVQHPYNTYVNPGVPPGPITNPSTSALRSIAAAEDHNYLYFVATGDGSHTFSRTLAEHNRAASRYHELMRQRRAEQRRQQQQTTTP